MEQIVFIYAKEGEIKVLGLENSIANKESLIKEGWKHTQTIDACMWIEYIHNNCNHIVREVKSLSNLKK